MMLSTFKARLNGARKSFTIWFNGLTAAVATGLPLAQDQFPTLSQYLPHNVFQYVAMVVIAGNFILRFKTVQDLKDK